MLWTALNRLRSKKTVVESTTRNREFKRWFSGSEVVDLNNNPSLVYASTYENFDNFDPTKGWVGNHFGTLKAAESRAKFLKPTQEGVRFFAVFLKITNPIILQDFWGEAGTKGLYEAITLSRQISETDKSLFSPNDDPEQFRQKLVSLGFDGIKYYNRHEDPNSISWSVLKPNCVWSLYSNKSI